ncbi:hypothetical protein EV177_002406 [Coemansia sp. RSA 1804]|nr:hypothetical protein EV177_002406 [Coemansia sp. RSA 1804]
MPVSWGGKGGNCTHPRGAQYIAVGLCKGPPPPPFHQGDSGACCSAWPTPSAKHACVYERECGDMDNGKPPHGCRIQTRHAEALCAPLPKRSGRAVGVRSAAAAAEAKGH